MTKNQVKFDWKALKAFYRSHNSSNWQEIPLSDSCSPQIFLVYREGKLLNEFGSRKQAENFILKVTFGNQEDVMQPAGSKLSVLSIIVPKFEVIGICRGDDGEIKVHYKIQVSEKSAIAPQPRLKPSSSSNRRRSSKRKGPGR